MIAALVAVFLVAAAVPAVLIANQDKEPVAVTPAAAAAPVREAMETSLWNSDPINPAVHSDRTGLELGTRFTASRDGWALGVRFWKPARAKGTHTGSVWDSRGRRLARVTFTAETASGWQEALFDEPVVIKAGRVYTVSYYNKKGLYAGTPGFTSAKSGPLRTASGRAGVYQYGNSAYPYRSNPRGYNYWVDVLFRWYHWRRLPTTPTPKPTPKPTPSDTGSKTPEPKPTPTPTSTRPKPTPTDEPSETPTPSPKPTPTDEPSETPTATPTPKPTPTDEPSETPTPTPTKTDPGGGACEYPTPSCTGVPSGAKLDKLSLNLDGDAYAVTKAGTVLDGVHIPGHLVIHADNVKITNSRIDGSVINANGPKTFRFEVSDSTIGREGACETQPGIGQDKYTATRVKIIGHSDGFRASGDDIAIRDSFVKLCSNPGDHSDGIQSYKTGKGLIFDHNTVDQRAARDITAPIFLVDDQQEDVVVTDNLVMGGTYSIQVRNVAGQAVVRGNRLVNKSWVYGPTESNCGKVQWSDNKLVTIDESYRVTSTVGPLNCVNY
ncbi:DUF4082 domain-containing protein [Spongiactinospora sp. TRM90649]|uniref:DUF4082 domain-containing protein n=1 Tax=Spongiactinospora sp. TRM90649 TaxID=3031114 RepID=UPI0023F7917D|nr:DUF4082 domain-containing protein [Spongiactinospora sp. TRM90649]